MSNENPVDDLHQALGLHLRPVSKIVYSRKWRRDLIEWEIARIGGTVASRKEKALATESRRD